MNKGQAQGTVKAEHLEGPVGIAHLGTMIADRGFIWVMFFLGLISVNLAVINFLPLPIVDGGQFLMLCYEGLRSRPAPTPAPPAATLAGLAFGQTVLARACAEAGIEFDSTEAHSAAYDAERTAQLFCEIVNRWKQAGGWIPSLD